MNRIQSVLIVSPSLRIGGIARVLSELANYFNSKGVFVTFLSCIPGNELYKLDPGIKFIEPGYGRRGGLLNKVLYYPQLLLMIRNTALRVNPDAVLSFGDAFNPIVLLSLKGTRFKVFISDRTSADYKFKFPIPFLKRLLYGGAAGMIVQTKAAETFKKKQFGPQILTRVIHNPVKFMEVTSVPREKIILYVGRFAWEKAPERLIKAFSLIDNVQGWQLHMAGDGPLLDDMKRLADKLGLSENIFFHGRTNDVAGLFARSSIYVLPSLLEGFPNALCEAMSLGLPCICFDGFPASEIITNNVDGIILDNRRDELLSVAISDLINDENKRALLGSNALKIRERLSVENIGMQFLDFLSKDLK